MNTREFITKHEARRSKPYKCTAGKNTIGVGYNFDDNPLPKDIKDYLKKNGKITDEMIDRLLDISINQATADCIHLFPDWAHFSENRQMALTDFLFQMGLTKASKFVHTIAAVNTGRWEDAAKELRDSHYYKQVPKRAEEVAGLLEVG